MTGFIQTQKTQRLVLIFAAVAASVLALSGCVSMTPEQQYEKYMTKAGNKMTAALQELEAVEDDLNNNQVDKARTAFNKAIGDIDDAVGDYAEAVSDPSQKAAVDNLKKGLAKLKDTMEDLEQNDVSAAQLTYKEAQQYFNVASAELWSSS